MKAKFGMGVCALLLWFAASTSVFAADTALRVVVVQTDDAAAYAQQIERGKAIMKKLGSRATVRVWRANFAGEDTGTIVVSVEYPSFAALAEDRAKLQQDAEFTSWLAGLDRIRTIVSDSIYDEL